MEKFVDYDRQLCVISGHMGAGKSYILDFVMSLPENQGPAVRLITKDMILARYWGSRVTGWPASDYSQDRMLAIFNTMTWSERGYANEILFADMERAFLIEGIEKMVLDMSMGDRKSHQEPLQETIRRVNDRLRLFAADKARTGGSPHYDTRPQMQLRAVLLFCDFDTMRRRMRERWPHLPPDSLPEPVLGTLPRFEFPTAYEFLAIDTSEESRQADRRRKEEIRSFFNGDPVAPSLIATRREAAQRCIENSKKEAKRFSREQV